MTRYYVKNHGNAAAVFVQVFKTDNVKGKSKKYMIHADSQYASGYRARAVPSADGQYDWPTRGNRTEVLQSDVEMLGNGFMETVAKVQSKAWAK